jgi:hypothetical protein
MAERWQAWTPALPSPLTAIGTAVSSGLQTLSAAYASARTLLQAMPSPDVPADLSEQAMQLIVQQAITLIQGLIRQVSVDAGVYVLAIPLPKKILVDPAWFTDPADQAIANPSTFPLGPFLRDLPEAQRQRLYSRIDFDKLFNPSTAGVGGNSYLVKTLMESIYDAGDLNRPRWTGSGYWAYGQIVVGASDVSQLLGMLLYLDALMSGATGTTTSLARAQASIVPTRIQARVAPAEGVAYPPVIIEWPPVTTNQIATSLDGATVTPIRLAVIRSTDFRARGALRVRELFPDGQLTEGATGNFGATVIAEMAFDGIRSRVVDRGPFTEGQEYYYHVTFQTRLVPPDSPIVTTGYETLSAHSMVTYSSLAVAPLSPSKPPDWVRTPSLSSLFPPLAQVLYEVNLALDNLKGNARQVNAYNQGYSTFLDRQTTRLTAQADEIARRIQGLSSLFAAPTGGRAWFRTATGQGTLAGFLADYVEGLTDLGDATSPPFTTGTELTASVILLACGPDPTPVAALYEMLKLLFGGSSTTTPEQTALQQIDQTLAAAETAALAALMPPSTAPTNFPLGIDPACQGSGGNS